MGIHWRSKGLFRVREFIILYSGFFLRFVVCLWLVCNYILWLLLSIYKPNVIDRDSNLMIFKVQISILKSIKLLSLITDVKLRRNVI